MKTKLHLQPFLLAFFLLLTALSSRPQAATITVTSTANTGTGSLRAALASASNNDVINFSVSLPATITLTTGELLVDKSVTILGPGANQLALNGNYPNTTNRVFNIANGVTVTISGLTIRDGHSADGGAGAAGQPGGGIYNAGVLTLNDCVVTNNPAGTGGTGAVGGNGGGIYNHTSAILTLDRCVISGNYSGTGGSGGTGGNGANGWYSWPWDSHTDGYPGSAGGVGGDGGTGGGIHSAGMLALHRCTLTGNLSGSGGPGGSGGRGGDAYYSVAAPGARGGNGGSGGVGGGAQMGGAIYAAGQVTLTNCTISGNQGGAGGNGGSGGAGGSYGLGGDYGSAGAAGAGGAGGSGGGICNSNTLMLRSCTIAFNSTGTGGAGFGAGAVGRGGGITNQTSAQVQVVNTIVALNTRPANTPDDLFGAFSSQGHNLIGNTNGGTGFGASGDLLNLNPALGQLADNGGPTWTHALLANSPAINWGDNGVAPATDQRGFPRIGDGRADIGAFEFYFAPVVLTQPATAVDSTGATLHGSVNPKELETLAWFEYGLDARYGSLTSVTNLGNGTNDIGISSPISGLLPWMTYHYRAVASNAVDRTDGPDWTFTLSGPSMGAPPSLTTLPDVTLPQGGSTVVSFTVSPQGLDVLVRANNPVLLPNSGLVLGGSGSSRWLSLAPDARHSGSAQVTVTASDGTRTVSGTFNVTVTPSSAEYHSPLLYLTSVPSVSTQTWRFRIVDAGTGSTNYVVEYRSDLSPTNGWTTPTNVVNLGGLLYQVDTGPPQHHTGFYRVKGFQLLSASVDSSDLTVAESASPAGAVIVFNGIYHGTVNYTWTDELGNTWTNQVQVNGNTAVLPVPPSFLSDNTSIDRLKHLTLQLQVGANYALGGTTRGTVSIEDNDAEWLGTIQTVNGTLGFELTLLQTNGSLQGQIKSGGSGFFPTNALAQVTFTENAFTMVATNIRLPVLTAYPSMSFTNYLDLRLDATSAPGQTNVSPTQVQGVATLVSKTPKRPYLDTGVSGTFLLLKPPPAPSTNEAPLTRVP